MSPEHKAELLRRTSEVFASHPNLYNHLHDFPWLTGALGDETAKVWFAAENPSLSQVERAIDPQGGPPTEEAQWWASRADKLFRDLLVKHGFKSNPANEHDGWRCYVTNVIKEADYVSAWRGSPTERRRNAALAWSPVLRWELEQSMPRLIVALGKTVTGVLAELAARGLPLPRIETVQHYSYVALRPRGKQGPMHPERVKEYDDEFARIAELSRQLGALS